VFASFLLFFALPLKIEQQDDAEESHRIRKLRLNSRRSLSAFLAAARTPASALRAAAWLKTGQIPRHAFVDLVFGIKIQRPEPRTYVHNVQSAGVTSLL
jgi:hypothetical protein